MLHKVFFVNGGFFSAFLLTVFLEPCCSVKGCSTTNLDRVGTQLSYKFRTATASYDIVFFWGGFFFRTDRSQMTCFYSRARHLEF